MATKKKMVNQTNPFDLFDFIELHFAMFNMGKIK